MKLPEIDLKYKEFLNEFNENLQGSFEHIVFLKEIEEEKKEE